MRYIEVGMNSIMKVQKTNEDNREDIRCET